MGEVRREREEEGVATFGRAGKVWVEQFPVITRDRASLLLMALTGSETRLRPESPQLSHDRSKASQVHLPPNDPAARRGPSGLIRALYHQGRPTLRFHKNRRASPPAPP